MMTHCHHLFFLCNSTTKKTKHTRKKPKKKPREGRELTFKLSLYPLTFGFRFYPFVSNTFSWHLLFLTQKKRKNKQRKKTIEKKKNAEKGGSLPSSFHSTLSLLAPTSGLLFLPFCFKHFLLGIFFFSSKRKERKTQRKKIISKKKNAKKGRSLPFFSRFYIWDEAVHLLSLLHIPSTLSFPPSSSLVSHVSLKRHATQAWELS
jgi:hypothetical protein